MNLIIKITFQKVVVKQGLPYKKHEPRSVRKQGQRGITLQRYE